MKVSKEQVAEHRARILAAAARLFRLRGFEDVTVAEVMKDAGLTHGAFYGHFPSKEALIAEAIGQALAPAPEDAKTRMPAAAYADGYLSAAPPRRPRPPVHVFVAGHRGRSRIGRSAPRHDRVHAPSDRSFQRRSRRRHGAREAARRDRRVVGDGRRDGARPHCRRRQAVARKSWPRRARRCRSPRRTAFGVNVTPLPALGPMFPRPFSSSGKPGDPR